MLEMLQPQNVVILCSKKKTDSLSQTTVNVRTVTIAPRGFPGEVHNLILLLQSHDIHNYSSKSTTLNERGASLPEEIDSKQLKCTA